MNMRDQDVMEVKLQCLRTRQSLPQVLSFSEVPRAHNGPHLLNFTVGVLACLLVMRCKSKVTVSLHSEAADGISCSANLFHTAGWSFLFSFYFVLETDDQNLNVSITCSVAKELHPIPPVLPFFCL